MCAREKKIAFARSAIPVRCTRERNWNLYDDESEARFGRNCEVFSCARKDNFENWKFLLFPFASKRQSVVSLSSSESWEGEIWWKINPRADDWVISCLEVLRRAPNYHIFNPHSASSCMQAPRSRWINVFRRFDKTCAEWSFPQRLYHLRINLKFYVAKLPNDSQLQIVSPSAHSKWWQNIPTNDTAHQTMMICNVRKLEFILRRFTVAEQQHISTSGWYVCILLRVRN